MCTKNNCISVIFRETFQFLRGFLNTIYFFPKKIFFFFNIKVSKDLSFEVFFMVFLPYNVILFFFFKINKKVPLHTNLQ